MASTDLPDEGANRRPPGPPPAFSAPPRPDRRGGHAIYRDVCFARVDGFRSLLLDLRVPEGGDGASAGGHLA
ncbi:MAG TPA: hypothetical protein VMF65_24475, partial [Acidimicrobiales bacterium]|nr:hypothetical protein [Acidimicrobiales bacterium]